MIYNKKTLKMDKSLEQKVQEITDVGAKTHKGRLHLKKFESQVDEPRRGTMFIKGSKSSHVISTIFQIFYKVMQRGSVMLKKTNDVLPFEDTAKLEFLCNKNLCPLFFFGNNTKKRPNNLILGRMYEQKKLDMFELGT